MQGYRQGIRGTPGKPAKRYNSSEFPAMRFVLKGILSKLSVFCAAAVLVLGVLSAGTPVNADSSIAEWQQLPNMGSPAAASLMPGRVEKLGARAIRALRHHGLILDDPEVAHYLQA